jgi:toxin ParE2
VRVRFLEPARRELDEAVTYYNSEMAGLGEAFLVEVLAAVERIRAHPSGWHPLSENTRRCRLQRFPYGLIYTATDTDLLIVAVAHLHRQPAYWQGRDTP